MTVRSRPRRAGKALLTLGAGMALAAGAWSPAAHRQARAATQGPCDIYAAGGHAVRGGAQHHARPVRLLQRPAVPGAARLRQRHHQHLPAQRGRGRQRGHPGLLLRGHHLRHHRDLRPVRPRQQPHRRARRRRGRRPGQPRQRDRRAGHRRRPRRPTASTWRPAPGTATTAPRASRPATTPKASTPSSTAPTTTAAAASTTATPRPATTTPVPATWKPSTSATSRSGATAPATAPGSWPTWKTACTPAPTPGYNANDPTTSYRFTTAMIEGGANQWAILGGNAQSGGLATDYSGRPPAGLQPDAQGRRHHPRHRRRQQQRLRRHLLRRRHDLRLPLSRHRKRRPGQHRRRRLHHLLRQRQQCHRAGSSPG